MQRLTIDFLSNPWNWRKNAQTKEISLLRDDRWEPWTRIAPSELQSRKKNNTTVDYGQGLFAMRRFEVNEPIGIYTGRILPCEVAKRDNYVSAYVLRYTEGGKELLRRRTSPSTTWNSANTNFSNNNANNANYKPIVVTKKRKRSTTTAR
jgi:hypothetical protein